MTIKLVITIILLNVNLITSKTENLWYPVWLTKDLGTKINENVRVGTTTYHMPISSTDSPVHVDLLPRSTESSKSAFPKKVDFLILKNNECLLKIPMKRGGKGYRKRFIGISEGIFPHPDNNERFVICHKRQNGNMECLEIDCLKGTYFDPETKKCLRKPIGKLDRR